MSPETKERVQNGYRNEEKWSRIHEMLKCEAGNPKNFATGLGFTFKTASFITSDTERIVFAFHGSWKRRYSKAPMIRTHSGFHRTFERITETLCFHQLAKRLRRYIKSCHTCLTHQTKRHAPYGQLVPIQPPFHTIAIDFVEALPMQKGYDTLLSVTDKFTKRILLLPRKATYTAEDWAVALIDGLLSADWGIPRAIISDRDSKFMGEFWSAAFKRIGTNMLATTAYHPQADGQSERTNQTVEIALRFATANNPQAKWPDLIPSIQAILNNSISYATGQTPT